MLQTLQMSGRSLRRLPVLAHARYISFMPSLLMRAQTIKPSALVRGKVNSTNMGANGSQSSGMEVEVWLDAMERVVSDRVTQQGHITGNHVEMKID